LTSLELYKDLIFRMPLNLIHLWWCRV